MACRRHSFLFVFQGQLSSDVLADGHFLSPVKYIPEWVPGATFKKTARQWREVIFESYNKPFYFVKKQMVSKAHLHVWVL